MMHVASYLSSKGKTRHTTLTSNCLRGRTRLIEAFIEHIQRVFQEQIGYENRKDCYYGQFCDPKHIMIPMQLTKSDTALKNTIAACLRILQATKTKKSHPKTGEKTNNGQQFNSKTLSYFFFIYL